MKFKTLGCELRRRLREQEQKNENIRKSCKLDQLFVRQSFQQRQSPDTESSAVPASNSVEEHAEHSEQRNFEQQPSAMIKRETDISPLDTSPRTIPPMTWCCVIIGACNCFASSDLTQQVL